MTQAIREILSMHMRDDQEEYRIVVGKSVYRMIRDVWRNVTPPNTKDEIVDIDYELFWEEATAHSLVEPLSSKMARVSTITLYRITHEENTGEEQLNLVWTTGTVATICDITKILNKIARSCGDVPTPQS